MLQFLNLLSKSSIFELSYSLYTINSLFISFIFFIVIFSRLNACIGSTAEAKLQIIFLKTGLQRLKGQDNQLCQSLVEAK